MASEHWRDLHREQGRFKPRPGAKGFVPAEQSTRERPAGPFRLWVEKTNGKETKR